MTSAPENHQEPQAETSMQQLYVFVVTFATFLVLLPSAFVGVAYKTMPLAFAITISILGLGLIPVWLHAASMMAHRRTTGNNQSKTNPADQDAGEGSGQAG